MALFGRGLVEAWWRELLVPADRRGSPSGASDDRPARATLTAGALRRAA